jgi:N6-L-threonylcarbamoyladenine synthase
MRVEIRSARAEDAAEIARVAKRTLSEAWSEDALRAVLERPEWIVGYAIGQRVLDEIEIQTIAVEPEWRRSGLGRKLVEWMLARARAEGAVRAALEVRRSNAAARLLYEGLGFQAEGVRPRYYSDGDDALLLGASLGRAER